MRWPWSKKEEKQGAPAALKTAEPPSPLRIAIENFRTEPIVNIGYHVLGCRSCGQRWEKFAAEAELYGVTCPRCRQREDWKEMLADWRARICKAVA